MKYLNQETKNQKLRLIVSILVICLVVAGVGIWFFAHQADRNNTVDDKAASVEIQTPYGDLVLKGDWVSALRYNVIQGDITELTFAAEIAGADVKLFDLYLGSEENLAGYLVADSGEKVPVGIVVHDIVPADSWSEEEEELAYTVQDALNEILAQLGMEAAFRDQKESEVAATEVSVETGFGVITYMDAWNGGLRIVDEDGCIIGFGTVPGKMEQKLFEISIGGEGEIPAGMYTDKDGRELSVFLTVPELVFDAEWTEKEQQDIYGMQNVLNDILDQLDLAAVEQLKETEAVLEDVDLTTPYGTVTYPGEYTGKLRIAQDRSRGYSLRVFATMPGKTEIHLFDILIGGSGDVFAGTLTDQSGKIKEVYLNVSELELEDSWTESEREDVYAMQMLLNDFCEQLAVTRETEESTNETTAQRDIMIHTPYGKLMYPGEYRQYLATEVTRDNGCTVIFYAKHNPGEKIRLFDLIIGGSGDVYVGQLTAGDGSVLDVYITSYALSTDEGWSDEEVQTAYGMQEAVNYVLEKLNESGMLVY